MPISGYASLCAADASVVVSRDKGSTRKHVANNVNRCHVTHYKVDGCILSGNTSKCDFLLINETVRVAYLIELKERDISHAVDQLLSTEIALSKHLVDYSIQHRIVCSKSSTHEIQSSKFLKFKKQKFGHFVCKTNTLEEDI